jgi:hypothetical protein
MQPHLLKTALCLLATAALWYGLNSSLDQTTAHHCAAGVARACQEVYK